MGFGGIYIDGVGLQHSKSFCDGTRFRKDEFHSFREKSHNHKLGVVLSKSQSWRAMIKCPSKDCESLKQEVSHLEKLLEVQIKMRHALESCLAYNFSSEDHIDTSSLPESAAELIEDVVALKLEVAQLEKYYSSLYHKAVNQQVPSFPSANNCISQPKVSSQQDNTDDLTDRMMSNWTNDLKLQCQSSLPEPLAFIPEYSTEDIVTKAVRNHHSLPLPITKNTSGVSLANRLGTRMGDFLSETPNRLSEDMVKCMSAIYCKLSGPPLTQYGLSSRNFTSSSVSQFLPLDHSNQWSPALSFDDDEVKLDNPFNVKGLLESNVPYSTLVEVPSIYRDSQKLGEVEHLLQRYQSIISRLEDVDPRKLTHEEKLAFWINVHNSLVMNAFLAFGIPRNNQKRAMYLHKAAYKIGGQSIDAETIKCFILRCRMSHSRQWIRKLFPSRSTLKIGDHIQAYAVDKPEPLLYFALASGSYSDPAVVHAYTPTDIFHELETAKNEYIRATLGIVNNRKIFLPKLVESFSRDSNISHDKVLKTILKSLPESFSKRIRKCLSSSNSPMTIEWVPHNTSFRYLISIELAKYPVTHRSKNT